MNIIKNFIQTVKWRSSILKTEGHGRCDYARQRPVGTAKLKYFARLPLQKNLTFGCGNNNSQMNRHLNSLARLALGLLLITGGNSSAYAELKLPNSTERRPNLSADPFERAREAVKKLPSASSKAPAAAPAPTAREPTPAPAANKRAAPRLPEPQAVAPEPAPATEEAAAPEEEVAFSQSFTLTLDGFLKQSGGVPAPEPDDKTPQPPSSTVVGLVEYIAEVNTGVAGFWEDGHFVFHASLLFGKNPSDSVGDLHGVSSTAAGFSALKIVEAFYQHTFPLSSTVITAGIFDVNSDFVVAEYANLFTNGGFGFDNVLGIAAGPSSAPNTGLGLEIKTDLSPNLYVQLAAFDGTPVAPPLEEGGEGQQEKFFDITLQRDEGVFSIIEGGWHDGEAFTPGYMKVAIGAWYLKQPMNRFGDEFGETRSGTGGMYLLAEASIGEALGVFFRYGRADASFNQYSQFYAAGMNYKGLVPGREEDILGIGFVQTRLSTEWLNAKVPTEAMPDITPMDGEFGRGFNEDGTPAFYSAETAIEATYSSQVFDWLMVQPTVQFVLQPSMELLNGNALVLGLRLQATY